LNQFNADKAVLAMLSELDSRIDHARRLLASRCIRNELADIYPGAQRADFTQTVNGPRLDSVVGANGGAIPPRNRLGAKLTNELGMLGSSAATYLAGGGHYDVATETMRFSMNLSEPVTIERRREEWRAFAWIGDEEIAHAVAREAIQQEAAHHFPGATNTAIENVADTYENPMYVVTEVTGSDGAILWEDVNPGSGDFPWAAQEWLTILNDVSLEPKTFRR
jgi:hypothetical protein